MSLSWESFEFKLVRSCSITLSVLARFIYVPLSSVLGLNIRYVACKIVNYPLFMNHASFETFPEFDKIFKIVVQISECVSFGFRVRMKSKT